MGESGDLSAQVAALQALQARLGYASLRAMAAALQDVSFSTLSRWMNHAKPQAISRQGRLAIARLLGRHHSDEDGLEETLRATGWTLTDEEWLEAVQHFKVRIQPAFPRLAPDRFEGRAGEIAAMQEALLARGSAAPLLLVVTGVPGAGKSALVQRVAGEAVIQQRFTGGCFWLRVAGLTAEAAQQEFLAQTATGGVRFDPRTWLRDARGLLGGRPALIVLDGVDEPLALDEWLTLAQGSGGRVIVTTQRVDLSSEAWPGRAWRVELGMLEATEARALLTRRVPVNGPEEEAAVARLLAALDGLPLALDLANRNAAVDGSFRLLAAEVADDTFATLTAPQAQSLAATFRATYHRLDAEAAALFRCLGGFPQPFQAAALAAILQWEAPAVSRAARTLVRQGLIQGTAGSYTMHRLLQAFALELAGDKAHLADRERRFAEYYLGVTREAGLVWLRGDEASALAAWHASLPHIAAGFRYAAKAGQVDRVVDYLKHTAPYLGLAGRVELVAEWRATFETLSITEPGQRAWALLSLAEAYLWLNQPTAAVPLLEAAQAACANEEGERLWFQATLTLGQALVAAGRTAEIATLAAPATYARLINGLPEDDPLLAQAWGLVGLVHQVGEDWPAARLAFLAALTAANRSDAGPWQIGRLLLSLGETCLAVGLTQEALDAFERGVAATQTAGIEALWSLLASESAIALARLGRHEEAQVRLTAVQERAGDDGRLTAVITLAQGEAQKASAPCID